MPPRGLLWLLWHPLLRALGPRLCLQLQAGLTKGGGEGGALACRWTVAWQVPRFLCWPERMHACAYMCAQLCAGPWVCVRKHTHLKVCATYVRAGHASACARS